MPFMIGFLLIWAICIDSCFGSKQFWLTLYLVQMVYNPHWCTETLIRSNGLGSSRGVIRSRRQACLVGCEVPVNICLLGVVTCRGCGFNVMIRIPAGAACRFSFYRFDVSGRISLYLTFSYSILSHRIVLCRFVWCGTLCMVVRCSFSR